jgi:hypothetical protein
MPVTATVEVLTAEVRVLMVGSRQITKSVFMQLDWVKPDDVDPMGRVEPFSTHVQTAIIGASRFDGSLVRALVKGGYPRFADEDWRDDLLNRITEADWSERMERRAKAQLLPLIVLAGLR